MNYWDSVKMAAEELPIRNGRFLITGATGLIGSCIVDVLLYANENLKTNFEIYAMSRSSERLEKRFGTKIYPVIQDICEPLDVTKSYDYILHAASNADPKAYAMYPAETALTNIIGTRNVLEYCKAHLRTNMVFMSTFEVYGTVEGESVYPEDAVGVIDFHRLRNAYPESKRCAELVLEGYVDEYGVDAKIARLASIYGPTMLENDSKAHAQFIRKAVSKENIVLKSEGLPKRTYCYVIDAVRAIFTVVFRGKAGEAYNIANEKSVASIAEVAQKCAEIAGTKVVYELPEVLEQKGFSIPQNCILENQKLRELGWKGKYTLGDGLRETIQTIKMRNEYGKI